MLLRIGGLFLGEREHGWLQRMTIVPLYLPSQGSLMPSGFIQGGNRHRPQDPFTSIFAFEGQNNRFCYLLRSIFMYLDELYRLWRPLRTPPSSDESLPTTTSQACQDGSIPFSRIRQYTGARVDAYPVEIILEG